MKQLIWKELREQRFIPPVCCLLLLVFFAYNTLQGAWAEEPSYAARDASYAMYSWILAALLASSLAFSSEFSNRTITFLTALPISRTQIWRAKVLAGFVTIGITMACTTALWALAFKIVFGLTTTFVTGYHDNDYYSIVPPHVMLILMAACYGIGLIVSPLTDRILMSLTASIVGSIGLPMIAAQIANQLSPRDEAESTISVVFYCLFTAVALFTSHRIFTDGHTFRPSPRFYYEVRRLLGWLAGGMIALRAAYVLLHL